MKEEELANKIKCHKLAGQTITCGDDWSVHKKGSKNKLFFAHMTGQYHNEYPLILELDKVC